jgi:tetrahydromethanopterin S-methyltransferase subunit G
MTMTMDTQTKKANELLKLMKRLVAQNHMYSEEELREMKRRLREAEEEVAKLEAHTSKGFGKK